MLLRKTVELIAGKGYVVGNIDATVCAERPKINPHVPAMKACLAEVMGTDEDNISIKATTTENWASQDVKKVSAPTPWCLLSAETTKRGGLDIQACRGRMRCGPAFLCLWT